MANQNVFDRWFQAGLGRSLHQNIVLTFGVQLLLLLLGAVNNIVIARALGAEGKGAFTLILVTFNLLVMIGGLGIGMAAVYLVGRGKYVIDDVASSAVWLSFILGIPLAIISFGCLGALQPVFFSGVDRLYLMLPVAFISIALLGVYLRYVFLSQEKLRIYNFLLLIERLTWFTLLVILLFWLKQGLGSALAALLVSIAVAAVVSVIMMARKVKIRFRLNRGFVREAIPYGIKSSLSDITQFMDVSIDVLLVSYFLTLEEVGYYSVAAVVAHVMWRLPASVGVVLFPRVSSLNSIEATEVTSRLCRHTLLLVCVAVAVIAVAANPIIRLLFGAEFLPAVKPLWLLLPGTVAFSVKEVLRMDLAGRGRPGIGLFASLISISVAISLDFFLIPQWGISGAAIASSVGHSLGTILVLVTFLKIPGTNFKDATMFKPADFKAYERMFSKAILWLRALTD
jgi:O-antigen/teichoic acid export membrane protein